MSSKSFKPIHFLQRDETKTPFDFSDKQRDFYRNPNPSLKPRLKNGASRRRALTLPSPNSKEMKLLRENLTKYLELTPHEAEMHYTWPSNVGEKPLDLSKSSSVPVRGKLKDKKRAKLSDSWKRHSLLSINRNRKDSDCENCGIDDKNVFLNLQIPAPSPSHRQTRSCGNLDFICREDNVVTVQTGCDMCMFTKKGYYWRIFQVNLNEQRLYWYEHGKKPKKNDEIKLSRITNILCGQQTHTFHMWEMPKGLKEDACFSVIYETKNGVGQLNVACKSRDQMNVWTNGLRECWAHACSKT